MSAAPHPTGRRAVENFRGLAAIADVSFAIEPPARSPASSPQRRRQIHAVNLVTGICAERRRDQFQAGGSPAWRQSLLPSWAWRGLPDRRPFRDLSVFDNVRIGALFGKPVPETLPPRRRAAWSWPPSPALADQPPSTLTVRAVAPPRVARADRHPGRPLAGRRSPVRASPDRDGRHDRSCLRRMPDSGVTVVLVDTTCRR